MDIKYTSKKYILLISFLLFLSKSFSCSYCEIGFCYSANSFDLVLKGEIVSTSDTLTKFKILETLKGISTNDTISIYGKDVTYTFEEGTSCEYSHNFSAKNIGGNNEIKVLGLNLISESNYPWEIIGNYKVSSNQFIVSKLTVINDTIKGIIMHGICGDTENEDINIYISELTYQGFKNLWTNEVMNCDVLLSKEDQMKHQNVKAIPNPFNKTFTIDLNQENYKIQIFNTLGEEIEVIKTRNGKKLIINTFNLQKGVYLVKITNSVNGEFIGSKKMLKE